MPTHRMHARTSFSASITLLFTFAPYFHLPGPEKNLHNLKYLLFIPIMYSIKQIVTAANQSHEQKLPTRAGLLVAFGGSFLIWAAIIALVLKLT